MARVWMGRPWRRGVAMLCAAALLLLLCRHSNLLGVLRYELTGAGPMPLTLQCNKGRLGNQLCTFATLLGLSALNGRPWSALYCNWRHLTEHFPHLEVPRLILPGLLVKKPGHGLGSYLKPQDMAIAESVNYVDGFKYPCSFTFFDHVRHDLRRRLAFRTEVTLRADAILHRASSASGAVYVGVHVRRGDYQRHWLDAFGGVPVDLRYFRTALAHFRRRFEAPVFVAVSDDRVWCAENLAPLGVYVSEEDDLASYSEESRAVHDLGLLASCNHTIMTYGTYGFWGAYLAGGETVYFDRFLKPDTEFARERFIFKKMYPPHWVGIAAVDLPWDSDGNGTAPPVT